MIAQDFKVKVRAVDTNNKTIDTNTLEVGDSTLLKNRFSRLITSYQAQGYLLAEISDVKQLNNNNEVIIDLHSKYRWGSLNAGNLPPALLSKLRLDKNISNEALKPKIIQSLFAKVIRISENNGYPFASVKLDSVEIENNRVKATIDYNKGPLITFDSLQIDKGVDIKCNWLQAYLGILPGDLFSQRQINGIRAKIERLTFVDLEEPPNVTFQNESAVVYLNLKKVKANSIDGVIGFLPNEKNNRSLLITGQLDMSLRNIFRSGKKVDVKWQSLKERSQLLNVNYHHPNILQSPLDWNFRFYLLKEDTFFINRKSEFKFDYKPSNHSISFFTEIQVSRTLSEDVSTNQFPEVIDFNLNYYGVGYEFDQVKRNISMLPIGWGTALKIGIGTKELRNISEFDNTIASQLQDRSEQILLAGQLKFFKPVFKNFVFHNYIEGGKIINDQLYINDLFRVGGLNSLRGFNENFFFASEYILNRFEIQYYTQPNTYIFLFYDYAYTYYKTLDTKFEDYPMGTGLGLSLTTKSGIINLAYAIGNSEQQDFSLNLSKFHFGYVAKF